MSAVLKNVSVNVRCMSVVEGLEQGKIYNAEIDLNQYDQVVGYWIDGQLYSSFDFNPVGRAEIVKIVEVGPKPIESMFYTESGVQITARRLGNETKLTFGDFQQTLQWGDLCKLIYTLNMVSKNV